VSSSEAGVQYMMSLSAEDLVDASEPKDPETGKSKFAPLLRTGKAG